MLCMKILGVVIVAFLLFTYLTSASDIVGTFDFNKPFNPANIIITPESSSVLHISWEKGHRADATYIEYNSTAIADWDIGDCLHLYNNTGTSTSLSDLNISETIYFKFWSYNETYNTYSLGVVQSGTTLSHNITLVPYPDNNDAISIDDMIFSVTVSHRNGETLNVTWYKSVNNSWVDMGDPLVGVNNGTYYKDVSSWGYDLYNYNYNYKISVESSGGDTIDSIITFSILPASASFLIEHFIFILMMFIWTILLILGEWKDDPMFSAICGGLGVGIIPASFAAFGINPYTIGFGLAWSILNFYILFISILYLYKIFQGRGIRK